MASLGSLVRASAGLVAVGAAALLAGCGGGEPTPTDSGSASTPGQSEGQPTPTSSPTLAARGGLDVQSLPADAIPWDQVGLGWFLLSYDPNHWPTEDDPDFYERQSFTPTEEEIYLVSPEASIYFVRDLTGLGNVRVVLWLESAIGLQEGTWGIEHPLPVGPLTGLDLESGASRPLSENWVNEGILGSLASGKLVTYSTDEGYHQRFVRARDLSDPEEVCGVGDGDSGGSNISPDGSRAFCLAARSDGKSDVVLHDFATGVSTTIDVFTQPAEAYQTQGWTDASSVIIERWDEESGSVRYWTFNVDTLKLSDYAYDYRSGTVTGFGANAHRVLLEGTSVTIRNVDGTLGATEPRCDSFRESSSSGTSAVVRCAEQGSRVSTLYGLNLETGGVTKLATVDEESGAWISIFPGLAE